ncbi:MAG: hypothetical protein DI596_01995 [Azospira oryzae]|nr:MAG: hypothetical protein DI596_01995 [Azospira oryzae]PZP82392.1 MAG: hypothetical protein DI593_01995 [Azospira oryzae]
MTKPQPFSMRYSNQGRRVYILQPTAPFSRRVFEVIQENFAHELFLWGITTPESYCSFNPSFVVVHGLRVDGFEGNVG